MANLGRTFNSDEVEPNQGFEVLPKGKYVAAIVASEMKATKKGDGKYLELKMEILEGEYKKRILFDRLNLDNPNQQAVNIANGTLSAICKATGVLIVSDSAQLHNLPMLVDVRCKKDKESDEIRNEVKGYEKRGTSTQSTSPASGGKMPWAPK